MKAAAIVLLVLGLCLIGYETVRSSSGVVATGTTDEEEMAMASQYGIARETAVGAVPTAAQKAQIEEAKAKIEEMAVRAANAVKHNSRTSWILWGSGLLSAVVGGGLFLVDKMRNG